MTVIENIKDRGYVPLYSTGTRCPSCGGSNWTVGRASAECARCSTAIPLAPIGGVPAEPHYPGWSDRA
ncbi:hypothetical protein [Sphingomonas sp.]|uniref:hypothetical protein n=1 Tax=Sphingomonas sp. TaxID=28214 RepID=UPI00307E5BFF